MIPEKDSGRTMPVRSLVAGLVVLSLVATWSALPRLATEQGHGRLGAAEVTSQGRVAAEAPGAIPETFSLNGRVLDPRGQPVSGARLYLAPKEPRGSAQRRYRGELPSWDLDPPTVRATTGSDGRFRFAIDRFELAASRSAGPRPTGPILAAFAEGYGPAWTDELKIDDPDGLVLRLLIDDIPIDGRLIDHEGHPVSGVTVRVLQVDATPEGDLAQWLGEMAKKPTGWAAFQHFTSTLPVSLASLIRPVTTGSDGRFRLAGPGRERLVSLLIQGPRIATQALSVMTRRGPATSVRWSRINPKKQGPQIHENVIHAADFSFVTAPTWPVEGVVRDHDTSLPLPGVVIRVEVSYRSSLTFDLLHLPIHWPGMTIHTATDDRGHYRLNGLPLLKTVALRAEPAEGQPYHSSAQEINNRPGFDATPLDFTLKRGVLVRGRVIDQSTGGPVAALVEYHLTVENVNVNSSPEPAVVESRATHADGRFTVVAYPGPGVVATTALGDRFLTADLVGERHAQSGRAFPKVKGIASPDRYHAFAAIAPDASADSYACDFVLTPGPEPAVEIRDADGRPLSGAVVGGVSTADTYREGWWQSREKSDFRVTGRTGRRIRVLSIHHEARGLAGSLAVRDNESGPLVARLRPWGVVSGRLVDDNGRPRPKVLLSCRDSVGTYAPSLYPFPRDVTTDGDGRFSFDGLVPELEYTLRLPAASEPGPRVGAVQLLRPGEVKVLGDVRQAEH